VLQRVVLRRGQDVEAENGLEQGEYEKAMDSAGSALKRNVMIGFSFWLRS
jgi:hypothetical protein